MKVAIWAEIRRLAEVEKLSQRAIARRLKCCQRTVAKALRMQHPPDGQRRLPRSSRLDPWKAKIDDLLSRFPDLSASRIHEEIRRSPDGYQGGVTIVREYVRRIRRRPSRVYQRAIANALKFFGGSPRRIIFDNLKAAVINGSGRNACLHPEFLALCGHFCLEPIACERRDPESKGIVEAGVRYVKRNALAGREANLATWDDYQQLAITWRDEVANVRLHQTTRQKPVDRFVQETTMLRPLPPYEFDTDEVVPTKVNSHAMFQFDGNRYSVPPELKDTTVMVRANSTEVRVLADGKLVACHNRCYDRNQRFNLPDHRLAALKLRSRVRGNEIEDTFDSLGDEARKFHLELRRQPVRTTTHLRRIIKLTHLYGREAVIDAIAQANHWRTFDAAYLETLVLQDRRRRELPSPTIVRPRRAELLEETDLEESDPGVYDHLTTLDEESDNE
jgi:transposase